ncbi:MAG: hypothetical protein ACRDBM_07790 [Sporomusa sp.]
MDQVKWRCGICCSSFGIFSAGRLGQAYRSVYGDIARACLGNSGE